ncbi:MAG: site-2 protease family protein [Deltaproteobacteria bacterium]|nr:site-2 protease family protein [Deltaproteobacteria bacterium]
MPTLHIGLFLTTLLTTTVQGALMHPSSPDAFALADGLSFSIPLMAILLCHEMGHYIAARIHRVPASLPYFVPLPPGIGLFGTMGAVILQSSTSDRRKLIDIGAAGPLAGLVVTIPVLAYGLYLSPVGPSAGGLQEGNSLLYAVLKRLVCGMWLPDRGIDVDLHPIAFAGWAGLFVTMLNLIPVSQLDGGHVAIAFFGNAYGRVSETLRRLLLPLAVVVTIVVYVTTTRDLARTGLSGHMSPWAIAIPAGMQWLVWYVMLGLLRRLCGGIDHPPVDDRPLPQSRAYLFAAVVMSFILIFMPVPLRANVRAPPQAPPVAASGQTP